MSVSVETQIPKVNGSSGTFVAVRVDQGGCNAWEAKGIFLFILPGQQKYVLANDLCKCTSMFYINMSWVNKPKYELLCFFNLTASLNL